MAALTSFYEWLMKQKKLRTPLGEFAREVGRDPAFPRDTVGLDAVLEHLRASPKSGSAQNLAVARLAYRAFERTQPAPRG